MYEWVYSQTLDLVQLVVLFAHTVNNFCYTFHRPISRLFWSKKLALFISLICTLSIDFAFDDIIWKSKKSLKVLLTFFGIRPPVYPPSIEATEHSSCSFLSSLFKQGLPPLSFGGHVSYGGEGVWYKNVVGFELFWAGMTGSAGSAVGMAVFCAGVQ